MRRLLPFVIVIVGAACAVAAQSADAFAGKWLGETGNGRRVALDLTIKGSQATGTFTLMQQTVDIMDGKADGKTLSFKVAIDGGTPTIAGELVGDQLKLVVDGVSNPLLLSRVQVK